MIDQSHEIEIDSELICDYRDSFIEHYEIIANCIVLLESKPQDRETINEMFRSLHTIKGNAKMFMLDRLAKFSHAIEESISGLRDKKIRFTPLFGEAILVGMDKVKELSEDIFFERPYDSSELEEIEKRFIWLESCQQSQVDMYASTIIKLITGFDVGHNLKVEDKVPVITASKTTVSSPSLITTQIAHELSKCVDANVPNHLRDTLGYFRYLALLLEAKTPHWIGRYSRMLYLMQSFNEILRYPVPSYQIEAAVYIHDIAYAFFPENLLLTDTKYASNELALMRSHPQIAADLLRQFPDWSEACAIVLHHHEKWDGSGYPDGLKSNNICIGAQMMSIVDAYEAMTQLRPDRRHKRSILRAVTEINNCAGTQFSSELVLSFNHLIKTQILHQNTN